MNTALTMEEEEAPHLQGVITIVVREARKLLSSELLGGQGNVFVRVSAQNFFKRTQVVPENFGSPKWNQTKHFPVTVISNASHAFNLISIEVCGASGGGKGDTVEVQIGTLAFHLHDIVKRAPVSGWFGIQHDKFTSGELFLDIHFAYGFFGYGFSPQLKEETRKPESKVQYSLYPRVEPPESRVETNRVTLIPRAIPHPRFIPFADEATLGYGKNLKPVVDAVAKQLSEDEFSLMRARMERLPELREDLLSQRSRVDKVAFLQHVLRSKHRTKESIRTTETDSKAVSAQTYSSFVVPAFRAKEMFNRGRTADVTGAAEMDDGSPQSSGLLQRIKGRGRSWSISVGQTRESPPSAIGGGGMLSIPQAVQRRFSFASRSKTLSPTRVSENLSPSIRPPISARPSVVSPVKLTLDSPHEGGVGRVRDESPSRSRTNTK